MKRRRVSSTSQNSATSQDLVLREGPKVRLVFRPEIVTNPGSPEASVKGTFVYQKKRAADSWQDVDKVSLMKLSDGGGFRYRPDVDGSSLTERGKLSHRFPVIPTRHDNAVELHLHPNSGPIPFRDI